MSIWGKIVGGVAGYALGGPLGALIGGLAGHVYDAKMGNKTEQKAARAEQRQIAFTVAIVTLAAKMAKADGVVTRNEIDVFKRIFPIPEGELDDVGKLFNAARQDAHGYEPYARQIALLFINEKPVLEEVLGALLMIAMADDVLHPAELAFLEKVSNIFGFSSRDFERIRAEHGKASASAIEVDPYIVLGVERQASDKEIKTAWRKLVRENHPDTLIAQGMPKEFIEMANGKMAAINDAWDRIRHERGIS
jgi:DnaJ like chaperone protein